MEAIFEILKIILPAIIAGMFTFFITKYTYDKNRPIDKLEIAYNRIYYPLYRMISDQNINNDINKVIDNSKIFFLKYDKYIDMSTKRLFESLCNCKNGAKKKSIYKNFQDNIYSRNSYLRRKLGYLESNFAQIYKYSMPATKSFFRITIELCIVYVSLISCSITMNGFNTIFNISVAILVVSLLCIISELIWCFLRFLYYIIRK